MSNFRKTFKVSAIAVASTAFIMSGVSHAQDNTLTPPSLIPQNMGDVSTPSTIGQTIQDAWTLGRLETLVEFAGLNSVLGTENFTVFAPRDSAFWQIGNAEFEAVMSDKNLAKDVVLAHIVPGRVSASDLVSEINSSSTGTVTRTTVGGQTLTFVLSGKYVQVIDENGVRAEVTRADVSKSDGVIHVINSVLNTGSAFNGLDNS